MRTVSTLLVILFFLAVPRPAASQKPKKVDCDKDLKKAYELIDDDWAFALFKPGYVDLKREYERLEPEAKNTELPAECADIIARFMASLGDGHSRLQYYPGLEYSEPGIELRTIRERLAPAPGVAPRPHVYVVSRDTTVEVLQEIRPGSEIVSIDGQPTDEAHSFWEHRVSGSTAQWIDYMVDRYLLLGPADDSIELEVKAPSGKQSTAVVPRRPWLDEDDYDEDEEREIYRDTATIAEPKVLEGGWGYIRFTTFDFINMDSTIRRFDQALAPLMNTPGLIIDVRGNGGGILGAFTATAGRFIDEEAIMAYYQVRQPGQQGVYEMLDERTGKAVTRMPIRVEPRTPTYVGPLVILIDRGCFSACESFSGGLQSIERATVIGPEATGGGSGWVSGLRLPSRAIISFSWTVMWLPDGDQIEGNGVKPDISVPLRPRDLATGRDRVLDRAIQALERGEVKPLVVAGGG